MSGTVPPPPPSPGGGPEPRDVPELGEPGTPVDPPPRISARSLPPSISPSAPPSPNVPQIGSPTLANRSGEVPVDRIPAPWAAEAATPATPTVHAPIPPAPEPDPWATQPGASGQQTTVQPPLPPRPAAFQLAAQQPVPQSSYPPPAVQQPTAPQPPVQQAPVQQPGYPEAGPGAADWWGGQWSTQSQPAPSYPPAPPAYAPADQTYAPADQTHARASQGYDPGYGQSYGQGHDQGYGGGYAAPSAAYAGTPAPPPPPGGGGRRRRLSPGWIAFIAVDVLLIVVAIIFAVQIFGAPPLRTADADAGPGSKATAETTTPPADDAEEAEPLARFASPSRNITCSVFDDSVTCGIAALDQQPAPVDGCSGTTGYVVSIAGADGKVSMPCVEGADQPKKAGKKMKVLEYGESVTEGDFTCSSDKNGMKCKHDPTGSGFTLARAGVGTF